MNIRYSVGGMSAAELDRALVETLDVIGEDRRERARLEELGITTNELRQAISVAPAAHQIDVGTVALIVSIAPSVNHVLQTAWDEVVLPRLRSLFGADAVPNEEDRDGE